MKLKNGEIRIYYRTEVGEIDSDLDRAVEKVLASHGYCRWGGRGFNRTTDVRDLTFNTKARYQKEKK